MNSVINISSGDASLATEIVGTGEPVVFLHANVCDRRMWQGQVLSIGATHRSIAYDRRGFGQTVAAPEIFSGLADLLAVLDAVVEDRPVVLVGSSLGGRIALDAALHHPARVRALILVAPNPTYLPEIQTLVEKAAEIEASNDLVARSRIKARLWLDGPLIPEGRVTGPARALFHEMYGIAMRSSAIGSEIDLRPQFDQLGRIGVPTLAIWGNLDFPHIQERCRNIVTAIPNALGREIPNSAHLPSLDRPDETTLLIGNFLNQL